MGIIPLLLIACLIVIFFLFKIPSLTPMKKIGIVLSVFLVGGFVVAYIFITGFERGRSPKRPYSEIMQENQSEDSIKKADSLNEKNSKLKTEIENDRQKINSLLFDIEGEYQFLNDVSQSTMTVSLHYLNTQLKYKIKTNTRVLSGDAIIELNEKKDGYYITFKNIEWSEYLGGLDNEGEPLKKDLPIPTDVSGSLYKNEITLQNYGNSMNYYNVFEEVDAKYILLKRK